MRPESLAAKVADKGIMDVMALSADDALAFFGGLDLPAQEAKIAADVLKEIRKRL